VEKFLKQFKAGNSTLTFGGSITTEDERGRPNYHDVGLFWNPWDCEVGRTVAAKNHVSIQKDPGDKISIKVFMISIRDRKVLEELKPTFTNAREELWVWEYEQPIAVFINGERDSESWTVSHWRMFSGRVIFDLAKNKIRLENFKSPEPGNGHKSSDELDEETKQVLAGTQLGSTTVVPNKTHKVEAESDPGPKPKNGKGKSAAEDKHMPDVKGMSLKEVEEESEDLAAN
jgi:hypothetical protein